MEDGEYSLKAKGRMVGGGPILGTIAYWVTKSICYGTAVGAIGATVIGTGGAIGGAVGGGAFLAGTAVTGTAVATTATTAIATTAGIVTGMSQLDLQTTGAGLEGATITGAGLAGTAATTTAAVVTIMISLIRGPRTGATAKSGVKSVYAFDPFSPTASSDSRYFGQSSLSAIKLFILATIILLRRSQTKLVRAKTGGGDGNRTHVRRASNSKHYMLIL